MTEQGVPSAGGDATITRTVLPGGLRVITESLPAVRSVAFGIWAGVGSRDEDLTHAGATHYLEHLLFKGTSRRSALDISAAMDQKTITPPSAPPIRSHGPQGHRAVSRNSRCTTGQTPPPPPIIRTPSSFWRLT